MKTLKPTKKSPEWDKCVMDLRKEDIFNLYKAMAMRHLKLIESLDIPKGRYCMENYEYCKFADNPGGFNYGCMWFRKGLKAISDKNNVLQKIEKCKECKRMFKEY